jgi:hypothetical protein
MAVIKVQECGCISLPDEVVESLSLYPGATLTVTLDATGSTAVIEPVTNVAKPDAPAENAHCG